MLQCWHEKPDNRPSFVQILQQLHHIIKTIPKQDNTNNSTDSSISSTDSSTYSDSDNNSENDYVNITEDGTKGEQDIKIKPKT